MHLTDLTIASVLPTDQDGLDAAHPQQLCYRSSFRTEPVRSHLTAGLDKVSEWDVFHTSEILWLRSAEQTCRDAHMYAAQGLIFLFDQYMSRLVKCYLIMTIFMYVSIEAFPQLFPSLPARLWGTESALWVTNDWWGGFFFFFLIVALL